MNVLPGMNESDTIDWVHLASTIDTLGNRGNTWVTPEGTSLPKFKLQYQRMKESMNTLT